jgi:hypothetical protein
VSIFFCGGFVAPLVECSINELPDEGASIQRNKVWADVPSTHQVSCSAPKSSPHSPQFPDVARLHRQTILGFSSKDVQICAYGKVLNESMSSSTLSNTNNTIAPLGAYLNAQPDRSNAANEASFQQQYSSLRSLRATEFRAGEHRGKSRPAIGKRRARKIKAALAVADAVRRPTPVFEGDSTVVLRAVMCGEIRPEPAQMAAPLLNPSGRLLQQRPKVTGVRCVSRWRPSCKENVAPLI